jgi:septal ring factor EnvC (AmiA/AmiB activator)
LNNQSLALAKAAEKLYDQTDRQQNVTAELEQLKADHSLVQEQIKRLAMERKELQAKLDAIVTVPAARSQESAAGSASSGEAGSASADNKSQNGELPNQQDSTQAGGDK